MSPASAARADGGRLPVLLQGGGRVEAEYLGDRWNARGWGSARSPGPGIGEVRHHRSPLAA